MMKFKLKTAVIGVGDMGKNHVRTYAAISNLVAVADLSPATGQPVADQYGVPYYSDFRVMLAKEKPDAVSVVVPTKFHYAVVNVCLKRHFPTLVEKPITGSVAQAQKLLALARRQKTFLMVGHIERFNPAVIQLKKLIDTGRFGHLVNLLSIRVGVAPPKTKQSDVALDLAIHDVDVFNYLIGKPPKSAHVVKQKTYRYNLADTASLLIEYPHTTCLIQTNWVTPIKIRKLYITGTQRFAELDYINQRIIMLNKIMPRETHDFFEIQAFSQLPTKEIYQSQKEPLKEELTYFLSQNHTPLNFDSVKSAISALKIVSG